LDELTLETWKESFGRRREVSLRLPLMKRKRKVGRTIEWLSRTIERGKGSMAGDAGRGRAVLNTMGGIPLGLKVTEKSY
jgi:hypothetical protein